MYSLQCAAAMYIYSRLQTVMIRCLVSYNCLPLVDVTLVVVVAELVAVNVSSLCTCHSYNNITLYPCSVPDDSCYSACYCMDHSDYMGAEKCHSAHSSGKLKICSLRLHGCWQVPLSTQFRKTENMFTQKLKEKPWIIENV